MRARGFTLLEMMIAIAIFAALSFGAYQMLDGLVNSAEVTDHQSAKFTALERTFALMGADFRQNVVTPLRGTSQVGIAGGLNWLGSEYAGVSLIRQGVFNLQAQEKRSQLMRVGYKVNAQGQLIRQFYRHLNPRGASSPIQQVLLTGVNQFRLRFFMDKQGWQTSWHRHDIQPKAIEATLKLSAFGTFRRVFLLPPGQSNAHLVTQMLQGTTDGK